MLTWSKCCDNKVKDNINKNISVQFNSCFPQVLAWILQKIPPSPVRILLGTRQDFFWILLESQGILSSGDFVPLCN